MSVFGQQAKIQYYFYHLTQSIWRKIQSLGLTLYENDNDFRLFCGQIEALAFLPPDEVTDGITYLRNSAPEAASELLNYFDSTYVSGQLRPRRHQDLLKLNFHRIPPLFPPHRWNMHEVTMADQPRTNYVCEGRNNKVHSLVGHSHPTIWKLIETFQVEANRITSILIQSDRGIRQKKRTKRVHTELRTRLRNLCKHTLQGRKSIAEFLC